MFYRIILHLILQPGDLTFFIHFNVQLVQMNPVLLLHFNFNFLFFHFRYFGKLLFSKCFWFRNMTLRQNCHQFRTSMVFKWKHQFHVIKGHLWDDILRNWHWELGVTHTLNWTWYFWNKKKRALALFHRWLVFYVYIDSKRISRGNCSHWTNHLSQLNLFPALQDNEEDIFYLNKIVSFK